ncbi:MAG: DUF58 domain-containing protein [Acidimicrobiia bacterium]|nr:DUF58 domain-containing protein [bacterium]MXZ78113.1 DUF58 domain-containing protein [Acidimicrobiia bacterium]MYB73841.1 DUF58 domain-containing protein [Acidimicrobiia bacterium]MYE72131.1 DUF58 domain-containing protein [Acidimicrobiia bacterium]MYH99540.1 DUF58 domain-containing protein [Acidimicrobiia bacterium]
MLTTSGWLLLIGSALLVAAGWIFGSDELLAVGVAGLAVAALSVAYVKVRQPLRVVTRSLKPQEVHVGDDCQVRLEMANPGRVRTPVLRLADDISFTTRRSTSSFQSPELLVAPVRTDEGLTVAYRLPTEERGRVKVGPLALTVTDPLGMSARRFQLGGQAEALVYPAMYPIGPPPRLPGSSFDAVRRSPMAQSGEELYGLRPFQRGDDPRRIHWRSSAHHDELIVRQYEEFSHTHTTVLLDTRSAQLDTEAGLERFEAMVSAAASICRASQNRGDQIRLTTTADFDSGFGADSAHLYKIYEHLALVSPDIGSLVGAVEQLGREHGGGLIVALAAAVDGTESGSLMPLGSQFSSKTVVLFAGFDPAHPGQLPRQFIPGTTVLMVDGAMEFTDSWSAHTATGDEPLATQGPTAPSTAGHRP